MEEIPCLPISNPGSQVQELLRQFVESQAGASHARQIISRQIPSKGRKGGSTRAVPGRTGRETLPGCQSLGVEETYLFLLAHFQDGPKPFWRRLFLNVDSLTACQVIMDLPLFLKLHRRSGNSSV